MLNSTFRVPSGAINIAIVIVAVLSALLRLRLHAPLDPSGVWGDQYFYWNQANTWLGLDQPLRLLHEAQQDLDRLYGGELFIDSRNGPSGQPPYVYRPLVPFLAGLLGKFLSLNAVFIILATASAITVGAACGIAVRRLAHSTLLAVVVAFCAIWLPSLNETLDRYAYVDCEAFALVSLVVALLAFRRYWPALLLAAFVAPLVKESLIPLALCVAIVAIIQGHRSKWMILVATMPVLIQLSLRILIPVETSPELKGLFVFENPMHAVYIFLDAFGLFSILLVGLMTVAARTFVLAFSPLVLFLFVTNSSMIATPRLWLIFWPVVVVCGSVGLWVAAPTRGWKISWLIVLTCNFVVVEGYRIGTLPRIAVWTLLVLELLWVICLLLWKTLKNSRPLGESRTPSDAVHSVQSVA